MHFPIQVWHKLTPGSMNNCAEIIDKLDMFQKNKMRVYVLYIPWILRINLFKPTNPKDELV